MPTQGLRVPRLGKEMSEYDDAHMLSKVLERMAAQALHLKDKIDSGLEIPSWAEYKIYNAYSGLGSALGTAYPGEYEEKMAAATFSKSMDTHPALKGKQSQLPDKIQGGIIKKKLRMRKQAAATATKTDPQKWEAAKAEAKAKMEKEAAQSKDPRLARAGVSGYNQVKRTPGHPTKSHIVVAKEGDRVKTIRFGQQGVKTNQTAGQREAFKSRHQKNIARGEMSAAYWADKAKWSPKKTKDKDNKKWVKGS